LKTKSICTNNAFSEPLHIDRKRKTMKNDLYKRKNHLTFICLNIKLVEKGGARWHKVTFTLNIAISWHLIRVNLGKELLSFPESIL